MEDSIVKKGRVAVEGTSSLYMNPQGTSNVEAGYQYKENDNSSHQERRMIRGPYKRQWASESKAGVLEMFSTAGAISEDNLVGGQWSDPIAHLSSLCSLISGR